MPGASRVAVELVAPNGASLLLVEPGSNLASGTDQDIVAYVSNRLDEPNNHDNMIGIYLAGAVGGGEWTVHLHERGGADVAFHAWIERLDQAQSSFAEAVDRCTLGSISCGHETICVGAYDAHRATQPLSYFSSTGPTRDGRDKPEVSAPGHFVMAARSGTTRGVVEMSGTSMAAPAVTGLVALMLAEAARIGIDLPCADLRSMLIQAAAAPFPEAGQWDAGYGYGRASAAAAAWPMAQTPPRDAAVASAADNAAAPMPG